MARVGRSQEDRAGRRRGGHGRLAARVRGHGRGRVVPVGHRSRRRRRHRRPSPRRHRSAADAVPGDSDPGCRLSFVWSVSIAVCRCRTTWSHPCGSSAGERIGLSRPNRRLVDHDMDILDEVRRRAPQCPRSRDRSPDCTVSTISVCSRPAGCGGRPRKVDHGPVGVVWRNMPNELPSSRLPAPGESRSQERVGRGHRVADPRPGGQSLRGPAVGWLRRLGQPAEG